jgi:hypothetical protein
MFNSVEVEFEIKDSSQRVRDHGGRGSVSRPSRTGVPKIAMPGRPKSRGERKKASTEAPSGLPCASERPSRPYNDQARARVKVGKSARPRASDAGSVAERLHTDKTWSMSGPMLDRDLLIMQQDKKISDYRKREWLDLPQAFANNSSAVGCDGFDSRRTGLGPRAARQRDRMHPKTAGKNLGFERAAALLCPEESTVHGGKRAHSGKWILPRADDGVEDWGTTKPKPGRMSHESFMQQRGGAGASKNARTPYVMVTEVMGDLDQDSVEGWRPSHRLF